MSTVKFRELGGRLRTLLYSSSYTISMVRGPRSVTFSSKPNFLDPEGSGIAQPISDHVNVMFLFLNLKS